MKAIIVSEFGNEDVLRFRDAPLPEPGENEVRVRLKAAGVNPVETYIRSGSYFMSPSLPFTPGNDGAGVVDKPGPGVKRLKEGQRVFVAATLARRNTGTYAEYAVCDADAVQPLPDAVTFPQGAGLGTPGLAAAYALFSRASVKPGETVLINGATGGVGTLAVQLARRAGAVVYGTAGSPEGAALLERIGANRVFNHKEEGYLDRVREASGNGPDVIIEMLANINLAKDLGAIARHGRIVVVGSRGSLDFSPRDAMMKNAAIHGIMINFMRHREFVENMYRLSAALDTGLQVIVDRELPLERAAEAHKRIAREGKAGKIVLTVGS
ncbi:MAG: NADPH:quinone reductase [Deltaproteobacteria bacterium]|nr:NADPH:quinone reductase [Deltaproteobacteria bacterium]